MARDGCRLQVGLPDPVATESEVPRSAPAAGKAAPPRRWAARARPRTSALAAATGYSGRAARGLPAWESHGRRRACDSSSSAAPSSWNPVEAGLRRSHGRLPSVRWPGQRRVRIRIRQPRGRGRCPRWGACTEGIEAWWRWLHGVGGDLLGDLTGVSDAAWRSRSSQRPAALAVPCGSRWVASGLPDADPTSAWPPVATPLRQMRLRLWCWKG